MKQRDANEPRKPYVKPELRRIELRPEEAVLGACKTSGIAGPGFGVCVPSTCSTVGS